MIFLDTNYLIAAMVPGTPEDRVVRERLIAGDPVNVSVIVWAEFFCGPVPADVVAAASRLFSAPEPMTSHDATRAAELFNATGRRRGSLADCMIAAICLRCGAELATNNVDDFRRFEAFGLRVLSSP